MKRFSLLILSAMLFALSAFSRPAYDSTARVMQPDGSYVTIRLVGDEYHSFNTTSDGYSLVRNDKGYYVYARLDGDGRLAPTEMVAHDAAERTAADVAYLESVGKMLFPQPTTAQARARQMDEDGRDGALAEHRASRYDYSKFRGLIILVEYNDCEFRYSDYADIMEKMVNQDDYTGESRTNVGNAKCTGSMRDYYRDNSNGVFVPSFDIVGPVKINRSQFYPRPDGEDGPTNYPQLIVDAVNAADNLVNFKDYDVDNDGTVDMVYFIFSGLASYITGNDARLLWPHQSELRYFRNLKKDGVYINRYACSTELFGTDSWSVLEGIGTMCHEFSHVLGLPDLYDTNNTNPDECVNPGKWSIMASGADGNYGRTPVNFSLYERYSLGFAVPQVIKEPEALSMASIDKANTGFRINTPVKKEYFLLENRQKTKWDAVLPGHGMLIFRVDSTNSQAWAYNSVNDNPKHPYYELVRAKGKQSTDSSRDPFPGTGKVTSIDNDTEPANLKTWAGKKCDFGLRNIKETNGVITFNAYYVNVLTEISLPESIVLGFGGSMQLTPTLVPENGVVTSLEWTSANEAVAIVDNNGLVKGVAEGETDITLTANGTLTAVCHVTVREQQTVASISEFRSLGDGDTAILLLNDAKVTFVHGTDVYIRDNTGSLVLSGTGLKAKKNDILGGSIFGKMTLNNRMPMLTAIENATSLSDVTVTASDEEVQPTDFLSADSLTDDYLCDYVAIRATPLVLENKMIFATGDSQRARIFNTFGLKGLSMPNTKALDGKYFDVFGILTTEVLDDSITYVLSITESIVEVEKTPDVVIGDVNGDGVVDVADIASIISVMAGNAVPGESASDVADVNGDGTVDVADISMVISIMAGK